MHTPRPRRIPRSNYSYRSHPLTPLLRVDTSRPPQAFVNGFCLLDDHGDHLSQTCFSSPYVLGRTTHHTHSGTDLHQRTSSLRNLSHPPLRLHPRAVGVPRQAERTPAPDPRLQPAGVRGARVPCRLGD
eukprot:767717-Hanusia_phi.AAC.3